VCGEDSQRCKVVRQLVYASHDILLDELIRPDGLAEQGSARCDDSNPQSVGKSAHLGRHHSTGDHGRVLGRPTTRPVNSRTLHS
jgi:hypothetical protein